MGMTNDILSIWAFILPRTFPSVASLYLIFEGRSKYRSTSRGSIRTGISTSLNVLVTQSHVRILVQLDCWVDDSPIVGPLRAPLSIVRLAPMCVAETYSAGVSGHADGKVSYYQ